MTDTVSVDLPNAIIHKGTAYGPGEGVAVPREVADRYDLTGDKPTRAGAGKKGKRSKGE